MKLKYSWIIFILSLLFLVPAKIYITSNTGDFIIGHTANHPPQLAFVCAALALPIIIIILQLIFGNTSSTINVEKNIFCGIFAGISGILMILSSIFDFVNNLGKFDLKSFFLTLTLLLSGIVFLIFANLHITGNNFFIKTPLLSLLPTIWAGTRLVFLFLKHSVVVEGTVDMFDIFSSIFLMLFFFTQSKLLSSINGKKLVSKLFAYGLSSVIMLLLYNIPALLNMNSNKDFSIMYITDIALSIYIVSLLISLTTSLKDNYKTNSGKHF